MSVAAASEAWNVEPASERFRPVSSLAEPIAGRAGGRYTTCSRLLPQELLQMLPASRHGDAVERWPLAARPAVFFCMRPRHHTRWYLPGLGSTPRLTLPTGTSHRHLINKREDREEQRQSSACRPSRFRAGQRQELDVRRDQQMSQSLAEVPETTAPIPFSASQSKFGKSLRRVRPSPPG